MAQVDDFYILVYQATKQLSRIKKNHKFSSLVFQTLPYTKCTNVKNIFIFRTWIPSIYIYSIYYNKKVCNNMYALVWNYFYVLIIMKTTILQLSKGLCNDTRLGKWSRISRETSFVRLCLARLDVRDMLDQKSVKIKYFGRFWRRK